MEKCKKVIVLIVSCILALSFCLIGCGKDEKDKKYDVTIKIKNNFNSEWIFTPDVSELTYEFKYTGNEMYFHVDSYNLPQHPRWGDKWFEPDTGGANVFHKTMTYRAPGGKKIVYKGPIKEKGEYCICVEADSSSDLWDFRAVYLRVTVL